MNDTIDHSILQKKAISFFNPELPISPFPIIFHLSKYLNNKYLLRWIAIVFVSQFLYYPNPLVKAGDRAGHAPLK